MTLTISDWIAIIAAITQSAVTIGAVVWQVRKALPIPIPKDKNPTALMVSKRIAFVRRYWQSLLSIIIGIAGLFVLFLFSESVTKLFVALTIFFTLLSFLHFLAILFFEFEFSLSDKFVDVVFSVINRDEQT